MARCDFSSWSFPYPPFLKSRWPLFLGVLLLSFLIDGQSHSFAGTTDAAVSIPHPYAGNSPPPDFSITRTSQYLTMRDGIQLAVDVYLPKNLKPNQTLPTIVHQTRYWRAMEYQWPISVFKPTFTRGLIGKFAKRFLANGYAWVDVDVRGSGASFGTRRFSHSPEEIQDGAEVVEWIIQQPWSNGQVGTMGISYGGASAELLLANQHPAVKAAAPLFSGFDLYPEIAYPGGTQLTWFTETWSYINHQLDANTLPFVGWLTRFLVRGVAPVDHDPEQTLLHAALKDHRQNWDPHGEGLGITFRDDPPPSIAAPNIDALSPFSSAPDVGASGAAVYSYSGWFDGGYQHAAIRRHLTLPNSGNKLIIGPWDHGGKRNISPNGVGPSHFDHAGELLKFFDYHLKGLDTGITREKPIHYFTMGTDRWKATDHWPPTATLQSYYLGPHHRLILQHPTVREAHDTYQVNPTAGTGDQSRWHTLVGRSIPNPYPDRAEQDAKLLTYTTEPLDHPVEVTGHPLVTLFISSTATDGTFFVYLEDVDESGHISYVTEGILRGLHRRLHDGPPPYQEVVPYRSFRRADADPLTPGAITPLVFDLLPTSYVFRQGHRIRIALAGADRDHFLLLPGEPPTLQYYRDQVHPSHIQLPVIR